MTRHLTACLVVVFGASACQESASVDGSTPSRVDSAGVEIVVSPDSDRVFAQLDTVPDLSLGGVDVEGPTQFSGVGRVLSLSDGSIWVRDGSTEEIRVFEHDGTYRQTLGGRGDGPEEFRSAVLVGSDSSDSVVVADSRLRKVVWYSASGDLARSVSLGARSPNFHGVLPGSRLVGELPVRLDPTTLSDGDVLGDSATILVWDSLAAEPVPIASLPSAAVVHHDMAGASMPFRTRPGIAVDGMVFATTGATFAVQTFSTEGLVARHELARDPRPVTEAAVEAHLEALGNRGPEAFVSAYLDAMEHPRVPDVLPAYDGLVVGDDGRKWASVWEVSRSGSSVTWHVYDSGGEFEGSVDIPGDFELHAASADAVLGVWTDELDVEYVRRYRLIRP